MQHSTKIDNSLMERRALLGLLDRIKESDLSLQEMEQIAEEFREAGWRGLRPLMRELWREPSGDVIARYAYLLDFFEPGTWLEELVQVVIKRRDLQENARSALLMSLEMHGVDVDAPPFRGEFSGTGSTLGQAVQGAIRPGEEGIVNFLDQFLSYPPDIQKVVIARLPESGDPHGARMLEAMLWHEDSSIARAALTALGRMRDSGAAGILSRFREDGAAELRADAERSLRRLSFLGIETPPSKPLLPFHAGYATPPDGDGYRSLFLSRWTEEGRLAVLYMQVHERRGLLAAWGAGELDEDGFQAELEGFSAHDDLQRVTPEYVLELVKDALYWSRDLCYLPADFYMRRGMFAGYDLTPAPYHPVFDGTRKKGLTFNEGEEICSEIFSDDFFAGWFITGERVHDFADEYRRGEAREQVLERFCQELISPEVELIRERLLKSADLMRHCGRNGSFVTRLVTLAESLGEENPLPHHLHPFLRGFAMESIEIAGEAMARLDDDCLSAAEKG